MEQKAKRYEYFEKAILAHLDKLIESDYDMNGEESVTVNVVDNWLDSVDRSCVLPPQVYMLLDKICDEDFFTFTSLKNCKDEKTVNEYKEFEKEIGEKQ